MRMEAHGHDGTVFERDAQSPLLAGRAADAAAGAVVQVPFAAVVAAEILPEGKSGGKEKKPDDQATHGEPPRRILCGRCAMPLLSREA
jgi:hypothetical protein